MSKRSLEGAYIIYRDVCASAGPHGVLKRQ